MARVALLAVLLLSGLAAASAAQEAFTGEVEVRLVDLEVNVRDAEGRPVAGLTREDFELLHDGEPVGIDHFVGPAAEPPAGDAEPDAAAPLAPPFPRGSEDRVHLVIYLDLSYLEPGDLGGALEPLARFLRPAREGGALRPGDRVMLATARRRFEILQGFTTVPELVTERFDRLRVAPGGGRLADEYRRILQEIQRFKGAGTERLAVDPDAIPAALLSQIEAFASEIRGDVERTAGELERLAAHLSGLPGRKAVLYLGGRVPSRAGLELFEAWQRAFGRFSDRAMPTQPGGGAIAGGGELEAAAADSLEFAGLAAGASVIDTEEPLRRAAEAANAAGVTVHTFDLGSLRRSTSFLSFSSDAALTSRSLGIEGTPQIDVDRAITSRGTLQALAEVTGGRALAASRGFDAALTEVGRDLEAVYALSFTPPADAGPGVHRLEVRLGGDRRLEVRHRETYRLKTGDEEGAERTISALLLESPDNPLGVEVVAGEPRRDGRGFAVPLAISLPLARLALVADGRAHRGRLSIFAASGSPGGGASPVTKAVVPVRIANDELLTSLGRRVEYKMELPVPSLERIAVTVRDDFRSLTSTALVSPAAAGG